MELALGEIAERIGAELRGDPERRISGVRTLEEAGPGHLSFLTSPKYRAAAERSAAGAILAGRDAGLSGRDLIVAAEPSFALAALLELFHPPVPRPPGLHPTVVVGEGCAIDATASIGPYAVLGSRVEVGPGVVIHAHAVVGDGCRLGVGVELMPHVVLYDGVVLGEGTRVHAGTVLGADGFGYASNREGHRKIPQVGNVEVGADVEIGALSTVDRALLGSTRIGAGTKIDNLVQVGHNVQVGERAILCGQAGIAGSSRLGDGVVLAGQAGVSGHLELGAGVQVAAKSAALESIPAGTSVAGIPAVRLGAWRRQQAIVRRLPELWNRLRRLERGAERETDETEESDDRQES
ncbi:MAG: UDP-3-O-(3-hydroxymyristoyl)glucosamine N-acyltransferase [Thermoanaerobaculia bacterium]